MPFANNIVAHRCEGHLMGNQPFYRRLRAVVASIVLAPVLLFGAHPAAADGIEAPSNVAAIANSPKWITEVPPATTPPVYVPPDGTTAFESLVYPGRFIRHRNFLGELTPVSSNLDRADATFFIRPGLSGTPQSVSLESANYPGHYLRHQNFRIKLAQNDGSDLFRKDASFIMHECDGILQGFWYFESVNFPNHYIRHQNFELWLAPPDSNGLFLQDSLYRQEPAP